MEVRPENFLVIDDFESTFTDDVIATRVREDGHLVSGPEHVEITNSIWDGQSLMDKSLFGPKYEQYGMLLLRQTDFPSPAASTQTFSSSLLTTGLRKSSS